MVGRWAAHDEDELSGWSHEERESRIVRARLEEWNCFLEHAPICARCRHQNRHHDPLLLDIRVTTVGEVCLRCWLDWPACEVCGTAPVTIESKSHAFVHFRGKGICAGCLVPEIPSAWHDWLRVFYVMPKSSYQRVFEAYPLWNGGD